MTRLFASALLLTAMTLIGHADAAGRFAGDGQVFSGIATDDGEGLILPQTLFSGGFASYASTFDTGLGTPAAMVTIVGGGALGEGIAPFPAAEPLEFSTETRVSMGNVGWGLTPYVGMGVSQGSADSRIFQGIPSLLPFGNETTGMQGVAGIAYQVMPGVGAGLEYRYQGFTASSPVARDASDNQTIMMRLDLGLN